MGFGVACATGLWTLYISCSTSMNVFCSTSMNVFSSARTSILMEVRSRHITLMYDECSGRMRWPGLW